MKNEEMEMSTVDKLLPRYFKGYDMDNLMAKLKNNESLSDEDDIILEAQNIYYTANNRKKYKKMEQRQKEQIDNGVILHGGFVNTGRRTLSR